MDMNRIEIELVFQPKKMHFDKVWLYFYLVVIKHCLFAPFRCWNAIVMCNQQLNYANQPLVIFIDPVYIFVFKHWFSWLSYLAKIQSSFSQLVFVVLKALNFLRRRFLSVTTLLFSMKLTDHCWFYVIRFHCFDHVGWYLSITIFWWWNEWMFLYSVRVWNSIPVDFP